MVGGDGAGVDVSFDFATIGHKLALRARVEIAGKAAVSRSGGDGGRARRGVGVVDDARLVGENGSGALEELSYTAYGGPFNGA